MRSVPAEYFVLLSQLNALMSQGKWRQAYDVMEKIEALDVAG